MKIVYIGSGFVGSCSAAVSADSGHQVLVYDIDTEKIKKLGSNDRDTIESCIFEEGLGDLLIRNRERITFTTDYKKVAAFLDDAEAIFMCLPTPEIGETGESDLRFYFAAAEELAKHLVKRNNGAQSQYVVVINKSTVPITMIDTTAEIMNKAGVKNYGVVSNPEFLVEGKAIEGSIRPDRVVVGANSEADFVVMRTLYERFYTSAAVKYIETNPREAAACKLLANFVLFNKLAVCFDVIGRTSEYFSDIRFENIRQILQSDPRIGNWGLYDSLYAGGSCFIKDARSLSHQLQTAGQNASLVNETYSANKRQLEIFLGRATTEAKLDWAGKRVAILGAAFKQDTNDIRNSPTIDIVQQLSEKRVAAITIYDPAAMPMFQSLFKPSATMLYATSEAECVADADVVIVATDWPQFRTSADLLLEAKKKPLLMDGRRLLEPRYADLQKAGVSIVAVGSPFIKA